MDNTGELIEAALMVSAAMAVQAASIVAARRLAYARGRSRRKWTAWAIPLGPLVLAALFILPARR